ncbi:nucleotide exchange factor Fes1-domain-containing protein [Calycina marina]|uniref:Nucleotide exchange factor Fes1-domain-containing protein n=1 Tax=Calycina marina TaxID=1763456 RepID=A0A9P8CJT5_9HELO|nr:nucleotide exchange factor Fes1-domain-containing protein [Calycina marina]
MDPGLNSVLKWAVENSEASVSDPAAASPSSRGLDAAALAALMGGPSDADMMISSMQAVLSTDPEVSVDDKLVAFDNFEQLIENLDNANNLGPLMLWTPLLSCLTHEEPDIRKMAAWCIGTAVQNNEKSQERLIAMNGIPLLVKLATEKEEIKLVRRKAVYALSSACRNHQPAMNELVCELEKMGRKQGKVDAADMDACDVVIGGLREDADNGV